jgi:hypothetical protein
MAWDGELATLAESSGDDNTSSVHSPSSFRRLWGALYSVGFLTRLLAVGLGVGIWIIFCPGAIDPDGLSQYEQATVGHYDNWFPPVMPIITRVYIRAGLRMGAVTLTQSVLGCLGLWYLAYSLLRFLFGDRLTERQRCLLALFNLAFWLLPLSPLMYHLVQYRNDTWVGISMAWISVIWLRLGECSSEAPRATRTGLLGLALAGTTLLVLVRYNAVITLPVFAALAWFVTARHGRLAGAAAAALFLASPFAVGFALDKAYKVNKRHSGDMVLGLDLVGVCVEDESLRQFLPHTDRHLVPEFKKNYIPGYAGCLFGWSNLPLSVSTDFIDMTEPCHQELVKDYKNALRHCPGTLLTVKLKSLAQFVLDQGPLWYHPEISPNGLNLGPQDPQFQETRSLLRRVSELSYTDPMLRFVYGRYPLWITVHTLALTFCALMYRFSRKRRWGLLSLVLLTWLAYGASFAPATLGNCYRYLYPYILMTQVSATAVFLGAFVLKARQLAPLAAE